MAAEETAPDIERTPENERSPEIERKGIVDGLDRIAGQLLRDPRFSKSLVILLSSIDPESARGLVRTLFWGSSEVTLSLIGAVPDLANTGVEALGEVARQVRSLPPALVREVARYILPRIDGYTLGKAVGDLASFAGQLPDDGSIGEGLAALLRSFASGYSDSAVGAKDIASLLSGWMARVALAAGDDGSPAHAAVRGVITALEENPDFVERVLKPVLSAAAGAGTTVEG